MWRLEKYRLETAQRAYWTSFICGLIISLVGVRTLGGLVDISALEETQAIAFHFVDVVLTGGVISGGSAAIDKMGRRINETLGLKSATDSKLNAGLPSGGGVS